MPLTAPSCPTVLIVDDEPINIKILANLLRHDYQLKVASDGARALEIANRKPAPDLILLDVMMPDMDGFMVCQKLKENPDTADIPVIFVTAAGKESECLGFQNGAVDYICKPISAATTLLRIKSHLNLALYRKYLQESHGFLNGMFENAPLAIAVLSRQTEWLLMNKLGLDILQQPNLQQVKSALPGERFAFLRPQDVWQCKRALLKTLAGKHCTLILTLYGRLNRQRWLDVRLSPLKDADGQISAILVMAIDLTETKEAQDRANLMTKVFENALEGIVITNIEGKVIDINPAYCRITGYSRDEICQSSFGFPQIYQYGYGFGNAMKQVIENGGQWQGEIFNRRKNGELLTEWLSINTVKDKAGNPEYYLGVYNDITQLKKQEEQLSLINQYDLLTGLPNRLLILDRMKQVATESKRTRQLAAICYLDLDGFKELNEHYGIEFCNDVLIDIARHLELAIRESDTVSRVGGDEFVILLTRLHSILECTTVLDRILTSLNNEVMVDGIPCQLSASIGVTLLPHDNSDPDTLLRHADHAMYEAKSTGKNRYHFFDAEEDKRINELNAKLRRIEKALNDKEFELFFQPKVDLHNGNLIGAEALIRWLHPERGIVQPAEFLPLIVETDLEFRLGKWIIATAFAQQQRWLNDGLDIELSINISPKHLLLPNFVDELQTELQKHPNLPPRKIQIEVLETAALEDINSALSTMSSCHSLGIHFALDDFGTGYSSLTYLCKLPVSTIKIDQTFIREMLHDEASMAVVVGIIAMAQSFSREIVAEGVETSAHLDKLAQLGCHAGQGYAIAHPMNADAFWHWTQAHMAPK